MDDQKLNDHYTRFANIKLLFIDEISIVPTFYLERIDSILKKAKQDDKKPFGGVTMVFCGDFLQLSPIVDTNQIRTYFQNEGIEMNVKTK
jgi:hypothetical protein